MIGKKMVKSEAISKPCYHQAQAKEICENCFDDVDFDIISDNYSTGVKTISIADLFLNDDVVCSVTCLWTSKQMINNIYCYKYFCFKLHLYSIHHVD